MAKISLTTELFPNKPTLWMDDVGPVVLEGQFAFCCECEPCQEPQGIDVCIFEKPDILPDDPDETIPKTREVGKRHFGDEGSTLHIRNFIIKFAQDEQYRKNFMTTA